METAFSQPSRLDLSFKMSNEKSIVDKLFFTPPFKILPPFYEENHIAHIVLMLLGAGLMAGDRQEIHILLNHHTKAKISSQSFEKIHNTKQGSAARKTRIIVENSAFLDYAPLPLILFENASFLNECEIVLRQDSRLYYSDILALHSPPLKPLEYFKKRADSKAFHNQMRFKSLSQKLKIFKENKLIFAENMQLIPQKMPLNNMGYFLDFSHYLSMVIIDENFVYNRAWEVILDSKLRAGISEIQGGFVIKALANNSQDLLRLREDLGALHN